MLSKIKNSILLLCVFIAPIIFIPFFYSSFEFPKNIIIRLCVFGILILSLIGLILKKGLKIDKNWIKNPIQLLFLSLFIWLYFSTIFSPTPIVSFYGTYDRQQGFLQMIFYFIFFLYLSSILKGVIQKKYLYTTLAGSTILAVYGILQKFGVELFFKDFGTNIFAGRIFSFLGNPDYLGQFIGPLLPIAVIFAIKSKRVISKLILAVVSILFVATLAFTESRAPLFGLAITALILLVWLIKNRLVGLKKISLIILSLLLISLSIYALAPGRFNFSEKNIRSLETRFITWNAAYRNILDNPVFGTGMDTYSLYFPKYLNNRFYYLEEDLNTNADRAHNETLETGAQGGFPAILIYLFLNIYILYLFFKLKNLDTVTVGCFLGYFINLFQNQFTFPGPANYVLFLLLLAIISAKAAKAPKYMDIKLKKLLAILISAISIVIILFLGYKTVWKSIESELAYNAYQESSSSNDLFKAIKAFPYYSKYYYEILMNSDRTSMPTTIESIKRIEGNTYEISIWDAINLSYTDLNNAIEKFKALLTENPLNAHAVLAYADTLFRNQRYKETITYYEDFLKIIPEFWQWRFDLKSKTDYQKTQYKSFFKNNNFDYVFKNLTTAYQRIGDPQGSKKYKKYLEGSFL